MDGQAPAEMWAMHARKSKQKAASKGKCAPTALAEQSFKDTDLYMAFANDSRGFAFSCDDAKMSICVSTWNTRLAQIARVIGPILIMTGSLPEPEYISQTLGKRPRGIFIIANTDARKEASVIKTRIPDVRIALHDNNAKVVLVSPDTVWVSSADFGKTTRIESAVGLHSSAVFKKIQESLFHKLWAEAIKIS